jgi:hypothetical protein
MSKEKSLFPSVKLPIKRNVKLGRICERIPSSSRNGTCLVEPYLPPEMDPVYLGRAVTVEHPVENKF